MTIAAERAPRDAFSLDFDLPHTPEKVWRAITEPALLAEWLMPVTGFALAPGAEFTFRTQPQPGWDGKVSCRMLELEPGRKLRYTWTVPFLDTVVELTLTRTPSGTRLTVHQSGFATKQKREFGGARYGWTMMGGRLGDLLARIP